MGLPLTVEAFPSYQLGFRSGFGTSFGITAQFAHLTAQRGYTTLSYLTGLMQE